MSVTASAKRPTTTFTLRTEASIAIGLAALVAAVAAALWIAVGAAQSPYLLELPSHTNPQWIEGPLRSLTTIFGPIGTGGLSGGLLVLLGAYGVALLCADRLNSRAAITAIVLANLAFTLGPTIVSTDIFGYVTYGRELAHGIDPYVSAPLSLHHNSLLPYVYWKHQPTPYGPLFTMLSAPLSLLSNSAAVWTLKAVTGAASIATAVLVSSAARERGLNPTRAAIFVGLNPVTLFYTVSGAHNDLLAVLLVVAALVLTLRKHEATGAAAAVTAATIKLTVGLALPFVLLAALNRRRALSGAAVALVVLGVPSLALFGLHFVDQLHRISTDPLFDTVFSGPDRLATLLGTHITPAIRSLSTAAAAAVALAAIVWALRGADPLTSAGWAFLALIASIASLAPWYLVWLLPLAALGRSRALRVAALLATLYLIAAHVPAFGGLPYLQQAGKVNPAAGQLALAPARGLAGCT